MRYYRHIIIIIILLYK